MPHVRNAREEDRERIRELMIETFEGYTIHWFLETKLGIRGNKGWQERKADYVRDADLSKFIVTEVDGEVVAFASYSLDEDRKIGHVGNNGVSPAHRGKGIGSKQIERVLEILREKGMRSAQVGTGLDDEYIPARRMYEKHGFKPLRKHVTYFMELDGAGNQ